MRPDPRAPRRHLDDVPLWRRICPGRRFHAPWSTRADWGVDRGASRLVALALLAPAFALSSPAPPATADTGVTASSHHHPSHHHSHHDHARHHGFRHTGKRRLHAPRHIDLLAARLYWGHHPPSYPSTRSVRHELRQTAHYFAQVSRGREHVHVRLTRWIHVRASGDLMCNTQRASRRVATRALRRAGYHPARSNRLMILTEQCESAASAAQLPGRVSWIRFRDPGRATLVHELGHNLGLGHAYGVVCHHHGRRVALSGRCRRVEYGDSWDAMGHSRGSFSAPSLIRLGWAGRVKVVRHSGTFRLGDVSRARRADQALEVRAGRTTYWVEYQPRHSPQVGRTIPGVMIRRQIGSGPVEIIDASPGNPTGIAYPDADLTNPALPVGSSLTTPRGVRFTTVRAGRRATVQVAFHRRSTVPDAPQVSVARSEAGYRVRWTPPADHGQIVLGYRVTAYPGGRTRYVAAPAGYRTSTLIPLSQVDAAHPTFTVEALNQRGWSAASAAVTATTAGPNVRVVTPTTRSTVGRVFTVIAGTTPDRRSAQPAVKAWAEVGGVACAAAQGSGPYSLQCDVTGQDMSGGQRLMVFVQDAGGTVTCATLRVRIRA